METQLRYFSERAPWSPQWRIVSSRRDLSNSQWDGIARDARYRTEYDQLISQEVAQIGSRLTCLRWNWRHNRDPILAAVGQLQFEVVQFRIENEYPDELTICSQP
jgi:hypothetical protein